MISPDHPDLALSCVHPIDRIFTHHEQIANTFESHDRERRYRLQRRITLISIWCWRSRLARAVPGSRVELYLKYRLRADRLELANLRLGFARQRLIVDGNCVDRVLLRNLHDETSHECVRVVERLARHLLTWGRAT